MHWKSHQLIASLLSGLLLAACASQPGVASSAPAPGEHQASAAPQATSADAATIADFKARIDKYMSLHDSKETGRAELKETNEPARIREAQDALAARIQAARKDAKAGDIFTPDIRQLFRRLMYPETKGPDATETKAAIKQDSPPRSQVSVRVNARYPQNAPLPTVPPNLLVRLPQLPEGLEYRIIGNDLLLRDVNANLIVDFIPNAIQ